MRFPKSKTGLIFSILYILWSIFFCIQSGPESFHVIIVGLPWSLLLAGLNMYAMINDPNSPFFMPFFYISILGPIIMNIISLYWIGVIIEKMLCYRKSKVS